MWASCNQAQLLRLIGTLDVPCAAVKGRTGREMPPASAVADLGSDPRPNQDHDLHDLMRSVFAGSRPHWRSTPCSSSAAHLQSSCCGRSHLPAWSPDTADTASLEQSHAARFALWLPGCSSSAHETCHSPNVLLHLGSSGSLWQLRRHHLIGCGSLRVVLLLILFIMKEAHRTSSQEAMTCAFYW